MNKVFLYILLIVTAFSCFTFAQTERETRAVWVATNFKLDWPPATYDEEKQKKELIKILDDIKSKKFNTVYFQVRSNATVFFQSSYEPFTPYFTGKVDVKPSYDPLKFAIEQAHKRGLEIHAWVNVVRCFSGSDMSILNHSFHIKQRRPDWVIKDVRDGSASYWMDMGLPEVRHYLASVFTELIENYDLDGIQYDFLRYPGRNFDDEFSYNLYGMGEDKDNWRRNNLSTFVKELSASIRMLKPYLKIGAAPIGIYKNSDNGRGFEGYGEVYQDSRYWLQQGWIDYLVPQIYWPLEGPPRFDKLAVEWSDNNYNRSIVLGMAAYKPQVNAELNELIEFTRRTKADGFAMFRYNNIKNNSFYALHNLALPTEMDWLKSTAPVAPYDLTAKQDNGIVTLNWKNPEQDSISYYALYNLPEPGAELKNEYLLEIIPSNKTIAKLAVDKPKRVNYYFTLKSLNKLWNESIKTSNIVEVTFNGLSLLANMDDIFDSPFLVKEKTSTPKLFIYVNREETIEISDGNNKMKETHKLLPGKNIISVNKAFLNLNSIQISYKKTGEVKILKI